MTGVGTLRRPTVTPPPVDAPAHAARGGTTPRVTLSRAGRSNGITGEAQATLRKHLAHIPITSLEF